MDGSMSGHRNPAASLPILASLCWPEKAVALQGAPQRHALYRPFRRELKSKIPSDVIDASNRLPTSAC
jgi:hypothetical protein